MIQVRGLTFGYGGATPILENWNATLDSGEVVAVTGASGRGKSTLLYLLGLMLTPTAGEILVNGMGAATLSDARRAQLRADRFGFVFQDAALDPTRTVLDNVLETTLYRGASRASDTIRARELLDGLGVELQSGSKPGQVSGGQAQRIALCRALLNDPSVLLADEPTGNLDRHSAAIVIDALVTQARRGATVVVVTHDLEVVAQCDRQIEL